MPFQPKKPQNNKADETFNFVKKPKTYRESFVDKENRKPNVNNAATQPKNIQGTYEDILKKYLNKKCNPTNISNNNVKTAINTPKAPLNIPSLLKRPESSKLNTARGSTKTLLIGTKEPARIIEENHHKKDVF